MSEHFSGILEILPQRFGFVRSASSGFIARKSDPYVPPAIIGRYRLRAGVSIEGLLNAKPKRGPEVASVSLVNRVDPGAWGRVLEFSLHQAISPRDVIRLEGPESNMSMRIVDLFCPLGKGQRALIVSPPKAGKTILMQQIAHAISTNHPEIDLLVLLIDERPEEVTEMRRSIKGEVFGCSSDTERSHQVRMAQLVLEYAKRNVEVGKDVVILLDSITRLGRAFNIHQKSSGRTLSGGVDARALEIPKRIFGAARNCEGGGSLTIIATALIDTGSRMDELIFQEFKGTGNMELVLSRDLANERIFPAISLNESGTRQEELLFGPATGQHQALRRSLARKSPKEAMLAVHKLVEQYKTNEQILARF